MSETTTTEPQIVLIYDTEEKRPACALLQVAFGANHHHLRALFPSETWLVHPTPGMKRLSGTAEQWRAVAAMSEAGP